MAESLLLIRGSSIYSFARETLSSLSKTTLEEDCKFQTSLGLDYYERLLKKVDNKTNDTSLVNISSVLVKYGLREIVIKTQELFTLPSSADERNQQGLIMSLRGELQTLLKEKMSRVVAPFDEAKSGGPSSSSPLESIVNLHFLLFYQISVFDEPLEDEQYIKAILKIMTVCKGLKESTNKIEKTIGSQGFILLYDLILMIVQKYQLLMMYFYDKNQSYQYETIEERTLNEQGAIKYLSLEGRPLNISVEECMMDLLAAAYEILPAKESSLYESVTIRLLTKSVYEFCNMALKLFFKLNFYIPSEENLFLLNSLNLMVLKLLNAVSMISPVWSLVIEREVKSSTGTLIEKPLTILLFNFLQNTEKDESFLPLSVIAINDKKIQPEKNDIL